MFLGMLDLTKAFDSVDRGFAWQILLHRGAPAKLVALIKDLHTGHCAVIRGAVDSPAVETYAGFEQGCVLAPDLFNLYLDTAVWALLPVLSSLGVRISYKIDRQLRECRNPTHDDLVWILMYNNNNKHTCAGIARYVQQQSWTSTQSCFGSFYTICSHEQQSSHCEQSRSTSAGDDQQTYDQESEKTKVV